MLDRLSRDGFPEIARRFCGCPVFGLPHPSFASFAKEGGDFDFHPGSNYLRIPSFVITVLYRSESYFFR